MPDIQQTPHASKEIATKLIANTMTLAADYVVDGGTYGISFNATAMVKEVSLKELLSPRIWIRGYYTTWQVLKFGFYPAFLAEIACIEAGKHLRSPFFSKCSDTIMPAMVGALITPASALASINQILPAGNQLYFSHLLKTEGVRGIRRISAGVSPIALRELLCMFALHHDSKALANAIATHSKPYRFVSPVFCRQDGSPTIIAKSIVTIIDISALAVSQPLSTLASSAAIFKYQQALAPIHPTQNNYFSNRFQFWSGACNHVITEGQKNSLSPLRSFFPGSAFVLRTTSLVGMYGLFKCLYPHAETFTREHVTYRK